MSVSSIRGIGASGILALALAGCGAEGAEGAGEANLEQIDVSGEVSATSPEMAATPT